MLHRECGAGPDANRSAGLPSDHVDLGLFELRPRGRAGIGRAFYCFMVSKRVVVLHAFIKKTQQTPDRELKLARKRLKELQDG